MMRAGTIAAACKKPLPVPGRSFVDKVSRFVGSLARCHLGLLAMWQRGVLA